jgi:AraC family transcriptional regulator, regulatory protein of adaptative response / methylated-DNA-[protein]-cysteine methyltransferase
MRPEVMSVRRVEKALSDESAPRGGEDDVYFRAVLARDARFDGLFFYAVSSTRVYCKPSCSSRRPRRERVSFYASCEEAEAGGFRACKRCAPRATSSREASAAFVLRVCALIDARGGEPVSLEELGAEAGLSPHHLQRTFKRLTGVTPRQYAAARRLVRFKSEVRAGRGVTEAMYESGYGSSSRLYELASQRLGMTPASYRRGGKGMSISYTTADCELGRLLVAATERGICSVQFGDTEEELEAALAAEYPAAELRRDGVRLDEFVGALLRHVEGGEPRLDLPLDVRATAFQSRVWEELRRIPYGETRSYAEVAASLGRPTATRAVARACATNPLALVTPCHRVVRGDGSLSGYRWGVERKRALLARERTASREDD